MELSSAGNHRASRSTVANSTESGASSPDERRTLLVTDHERRVQRVLEALDELSELLEDKRDWDPVTA